MIIMFPTNEDIGLQANMVDDFDNAQFYTLVRINPKGAVISIKSISKDNATEINPYAIVSSNTINNPKYKNTSIFIDKTSTNVDNALVKLLKEKLFKKAS